MRKYSVAVAVVMVLFMFLGVQLASAQDLSGKVVETMDAGGYTYVCIEKDGVKTWVAVPQTKIEVGQEVTFKPGMAMQNFTSKSLNRTFDVVYFSEGLLSH